MKRNIISTLWIGSGIVTVIVGAIYNNSLIIGGGFGVLLRSIFCD